MGAEEHRKKAPKKFKFAVITVSDTASRGEKEDASGKFLMEALKESGNENVHYTIVPDEKLAIIKAVIESIEKGADVIVTTGGTGITSRDVTIESIRTLFDKELVGFGEVFRVRSYEEIGTAVVLTRATAGIIRSDGRAIVVFCLPGSLNAVKTGVEIIKREAYHVLKHARE
ncbi:MogA/MoaB family molybdenum cofactor biosynthesis protein [Thermococcus sp. GR7]|uniref:MogA/MoaB family molybdenum cofactor biosynthesis protein n=1 Tax=unclassified Thermococcus TaxID=2627626 RepID=UPI00143096E2|nr:MULTISPECIES: MogA/MoaB family molybdenum cofactor biosynthesis protein [unclassified Thermococcus]NJE47293.1 MogA/MoaB family molybdenum cofactor biosynthesis protein [Thermococcus sp. GR7]NJE78658.1 MogA/MoaB family molybdenum cofactor biosynthesis protein [Thermococcus sp. GR4]NJF23217.1 MogA/MoaB family molybdenum cofactor biosynthesis protein [Thermococcus sp. GR5]